jgi:hypothetical protein
MPFVKSVLGSDERNRSAHVLFKKVAETVSMSFFGDDLEGIRADRTLCTHSISSSSGLPEIDVVRRLLLTILAAEIRIHPIT